MLTLLGFILSGNTIAEEITYLIVEDISKPFQITDDGISKGGIISDIIDEIFKDSEYTVKHHVLPVKRLYKVVESEEINNWITYDAKAWNSLSRWGDFIDIPLFSVNHTYLTCQKDTHKKITSRKDIEGQNLAVIKDFDYPELNQLKDRGQLHLTPVTNYQQGISLTGLNRVDGFVEMELRLRFTIKQESLGKPCFQFIDMSKIIPVYPIYLTTGKHNKSGINEFAAKRINELKESGTIDAILSRYTH